MPLIISAYAESRDNNDMTVNLGIFQETVHRRQLKLYRQVPHFPELYPTYRFVSERDNS